MGSTVLVSRVVTSDIVVALANFMVLVVAGIDRDALLAGTAVALLEGVTCIVLVPDFVFNGILSVTELAGFLVGARVLPATKEEAAVVVVVLLTDSIGPALEVFETILEVIGTVIETFTAAVNLIEATAVVVMAPTDLI